MDIEDYKKENAELHQRVADLEKANNELIIHNIQLGKKVDAYYDVRRRIHIYKELLLRHTEFLRHADLRNDDELDGSHRVKTGDGETIRGSSVRAEGTGRYDRDVAITYLGLVP